MKIHFYVRFYTRPGQQMAVTGNIAELGNEVTEKAFVLQWLNKDFWFGAIDIDPTQTAKLHYKYILKEPDGFTVMEWGDDRRVDLSKAGIRHLQLIDTWNAAGEYENAFFTDPFQQILLSKQSRGIKPKAVKQFTHIFRVKAPLLEANETICLLGNGISMGEWDTASPVLLHRDHNWWTVKLNLQHEIFPHAYKYGIYNTREKKFVGYEAGGNRHLLVDEQPDKLTVLHDGFVHLPNTTWKGAGVSIPVFSLRTKNSFGVGEFTDLLPLVDWAKKTGLQLIQILPVNDTIATHSWVDTYPYAAISAFALNPLYLNLSVVAGKKYAGLLKPLRKTQKVLNDMPAVSYEEVIKLKLATVRELFEVQKDDFLQDEDFLAFFAQNKHWLVPYAAFCYLRDRNGTSDFSKWKLYSEYNQAAIEKYVAPKAKHYHDVALHYFIQYHLHTQLKEAAEYAHKNGLILKGDIPIGVYRYGCDAWEKPALYHMDMQAGAPPDDFAVKGQNWGFPAYNWDRMAESGFDWWHKRFVQMSYYFDAFRIDHILGFFRIWSIPMHAVEGIMGFFVKALPVRQQDFEQWSIPFDPFRYSRPYINDAVLWEMFGPNNEKFKPYLDVTESGYALKRGYDTQRDVAAAFGKLEQTDELLHIKQGLFDLISNVILLEQPGSAGAFHFRFGMDGTTSFRHLDWWIQQRLKDLYVDYFYRRQDNFWMQEALKKLPALKRSTNMLICGEDLGMVPHCVPVVMKQLGILSLEIQRMPKDPTVEFFNPANAPYLSVVTPSTHDMSTIRGWWQENRDKTQRFYNHELGQPDEAPAECEAWINKAIVRQHLQSPAMWAIFQLQDLLGMDEKLRRANPQEERINVPAISSFYWNYRMHLNLEDLLKEKGFNEELKRMVKEGGR